MTRHLRTYIQNTFRRNRQTVYDVISHNYAAWDWPRDRKRVGEQLAALLGDGQVLAPTVEAARFHADCRLSNQTKRQQQQQGSATYLYSIESTRLGTMWNGNQSSATDRVPADELIYVFGSALVAGVQPYVGYQPTPADKVISETILGYWTNFVRTG
jgi:carboxylesterase type B